LAIAVIAVLAVVFGVTVPFKDIQLARADAFVPALQVAITINDLVTSTLLFAQFAIIRRRSLQVLACGYLFTALIVVTYALSFPGAFSPSGLLGAGLQTAPWLYWFWHVALPIAAIAYVLLKDVKDGAGSIGGRNAAIPVVWSVAVVVSLVVGLTVLATAGESYLPIIMRDGVAVNLGIRLSYGGPIVLAIVTALALLWSRRRSVLDLWLIVTCCSMLFELALGTVFVSSRYSIGWYASRIYAYAASIFVLLVLLAETTALYARLARSNMLLRNERANKLMNVEAVAVAIAHEVRQPLAAITLNSETARIFLGRAPPDLEEVQSLLSDIASEGQRASRILEGVRGVWREDRENELVDLNTTALETLQMFQLPMNERNIATRAQLEAELPPVAGHKVQLQEVVANLVKNAIEAMEDVGNDRRALSIRTGRGNDGLVVLEVEDSGPGIDADARKRIFDAFATTKPHGTGLGLAICQRIIERHGGEISVAASHPRGAIFRVSLPAARSDRAG
jgi:signal transduction histidine kinase